MRTKLFAYLLAPLLIIVYFTTMMNEGQPVGQPVGVVDLDGSATTRALIRKLDAFPSTDIRRVYSTESEARNDMQRGRIYGYIVLPHGMNADLVANRQPVVTLYYNTAYFTGAILAYKDLRTLATLARAAAGASVLRAKGATERQIATFLQPVQLDTHLVGNPWANYNAFLSTMVIPGLIMMFIAMMTVYVLGVELRAATASATLLRHKGNVWRMLVHKLAPVTLVYWTVMHLCQIYFYAVLNFPHAGGWATIMLVTTLVVLATQGFALFVFCLVPHFRMALSICALWSVLNISMSGTAFPVEAMHPMLQQLASLFPLRHYFMAFQLAIFHGYPLLYALTPLAALALFVLLPLPLVPRLRRIFETYTYMP